MQLLMQFLSRTITALLLSQGCTNASCLVVQANELSTVVHKICGSSVWTLILATKGPSINA
jgi:hypothetical protein